MMRRFVFIAALTLAGCSSKNAVGVKVDPSLEALVPPDTVLLVGTRLEALQKTPVYQRYFAGEQFSQVEDFARRTGLDPRKDLRELLFVSNGHSGVLLGRGKFPSDVAPKLEKEGAERFAYKGFDLIGNEKGAVVFIDSTTAAVGEIATLHSFIDQRGQSHGPPAALAALMKDIPPEAQFWGAYTGGSITLPLEGNLANVNKLLGYVQSGSIYFDLRSGLSSVAKADCSTEQGAQEVQGALKALAGIGRLSTPKDQPELAQVYDGIRVTQDSRQVKLYIDVPQRMVDKFLALWMGGHGSTRPNRGQ